MTENRESLELYAIILNLLTRRVFPMWCHYGHYRPANALIIYLPDFDSFYHFKVCFIYKYIN